MTNTSEFDYEGYGRLPQSVINAAAAEYIVKFLMPELQSFMAMAIEALSHDCEIEAAEAEQVIIERLQVMTQRLKPGQYTVNHAAILFGLWAVFSEYEDENMLAANDSLATGQPIESAPPADDNPIDCDELLSSAEDKPLQWRDWQSDTDLTGDNGAN